MPFTDLFSKRKSRGEVPDVYKYESIPRELRVQVIHILQDAYGEHFYYDPESGIVEEYEYWDEYRELPQYCGPSPSIVERYNFIHGTLCRGYGTFTLGERDASTKAILAVMNFFLDTHETEKAIDVIELSFQQIDQYVSYIPHELENVRTSSDEAIAELNHRFLEHGVGYQYESGQVIRVDSQLIHSEVVRPALQMLSDPMYEGANAVFLSAHEHYRKGRYNECLNDCLKAFESCLKAICVKRGWGDPKEDTAKSLLTIVFKEGLIPPFMESHFKGLRGALESGVSTMRNKLTGHGNVEIITVPDYIAAYALHLTASDILLLAKADEENCKEEPTHDKSALMID